MATTRGPQIGTFVYFVMALIALCSGPGGRAETSDPNGPADYFDMSIEELMKVEVKSAAGLTKMDSRQVPVAMTVLDDKDIEQSGARDLNHLLEIYVPNSQFILHHHLQPHLGFRGIISDREDKYLYQVNGRTMNNRTLLGADNERSLPLLGDIRSVSVVRGPASATHGAGALAGVIDVETYNGLTYQGSEIGFRQGIVDRYSAVETKYGEKFSDESGLFVYYGLADVLGADGEYYIGHSYPAANGLPPNVAGHPYEGPMAAFDEAGFDALWHKLHVSYMNGPFEFWTRFVQDGSQDRPMREIYTKARPADVSLDEWTRGREFRNRQITTTGRFKKDLSEQWNLELVQSFDVWLYKNRLMGTSPEPTQRGRETEWFSHAILTWTPNQAHSLAFGADYSHEWFNDPPFSYALDRAPAITDRKWQTDTLSFMAEHQWKINKHWTTFLSIRTDKHTFSDWLFSPRASVIFTPTERDTFKIIAGQSVRRSCDEELWSQWERQRTTPKPEKLRSYEISYERKMTDHWRVGGSGFFEDYDAIGWIPTWYYSSSIGDFQIAGGEIVISYTSPSTRLTLSQGVSKLVNSHLPGTLPEAGQTVTAEPYGYGNDLAEWSPFITKLAVVHNLDREWTVSSSLVYYSGFPGAKDYADYASTLSTPPSAVPLSDPGYTKPYGPNLFVNLGLQYHPSEHWTFRVDGYNLAELFDKTLSKRNYYFRMSEFSVMPASLAFSASYRF